MHLSMIHTDRDVEDHPRKRRKTSLPLTSVTLKLNASVTPTRAASEDGSLSAPARASFMSPTKASLARFNPHLLSPAISSEKKRQDQVNRQSQIFGEAQRPALNVEEKMVKDISTAPQQKTQPIRELADSQESIEGRAIMSPGLGIAPNGDAFHHSSRRSQTPPREPLSAGQLQAAVEQDLRASPPEAARDGEQISLDADPVQKPPGSQGSISEHINTTIDTIENEKEQADGREPGLPITPTKNVLEGAEPRLPPTPSQLGLEAPSSSPKGLSFCRPSRKLKRKKRSQVKSSPLKPRDPSPVMKSVENPPPSGLGPRIPVTSTQQSKTTQPQGRRKYTDRPAASNSNLYVDLSRKPSTLSQRLALFLPFSRPLISDPDLPTQNSTSQKDTGAINIDTTENTILSATCKDPALQHQNVVLTSPQQLLVVKLQTSTDRESRKNTALSVSSISPWANPELGRWLRVEAVQLETPIIQRTVCRYWELSEIRASCWHRCEQDLKQNSDPTRDREQQQQQQQATPRQEPNNAAPSRLGQQSILFTGRPTTSLLITWQLTIEPAGAVHSTLAAHAAFPDAWTQAPRGDALAKVGDAFELLVEQVGVFQAVKVIWGLIFGA